MSEFEEKTDLFIKEVATGAPRDKYRPCTDPLYTVSIWNEKYLVEFKHYINNSDKKNAFDRVSSLREKYALKWLPICFNYGPHYFGNDFWDIGVDIAIGYVNFYIDSVDDTQEGYLSITKAIEAGFIESFAEFFYIMEKMSYHEKRDLSYDLVWCEQQVYASLFFWTELYRNKREPKADE